MSSSSLTLESTYLTRLLLLKKNKNKGSWTSAFVCYNDSHFEDDHEQPLKRIEPVDFIPLDPFEPLYNIPSSSSTSSSSPRRRIDRQNTTTTRPPTKGDLGQHEKVRLSSFPLPPPRSILPKDHNDHSSTSTPSDAVASNSRNDIGRNNRSAEQQDRRRSKKISTQLESISSECCRVFEELSHSSSREVEEDGNDVEDVDSEGSDVGTVWSWFEEGGEEALEVFEKNLFFLRPVAMKTDRVHNGMKMTTTTEPEYHEHHEMEEGSFSRSTTQDTLFSSSSSSSNGSKTFHSSASVSTLATSIGGGEDEERYLESSKKSIDFESILTTMMGRS